MTLSDCNHLARVIVLWQYKNLYVFALFYLVLRVISKYKPPGAYIRRGDLTVVFLRYKFGGLIFRGAYTWRSLCSEFYGIYYTNTNEVPRHFTLIFFAVKGTIYYSAIAMVIF